MLVVRIDRAPFVVVVLVVTECIGRRWRGGGDASAMPVADAPLAPPFACVGSVISGSGGASTRGAGGGGAGRGTCRSTERPSSSLSSSSLSIGLPLGAF